MNTNPFQPQTNKYHKLVNPIGNLPSIEEQTRFEVESRMTDHGYAHVLYNRLMSQIADFEASLDPTDEIAAYLSSFGTSILIRITSIGYHNPYFIVFYGTQIGSTERVQLVQHTTQLNVLFVAAKVEEERPARRIGFHTEENAA